MKIGKFGFGAVVLAMLSMPAAADVYAGSFSVSGMTGPVKTMSGTFALTFDPLVPADNFEFDSLSISVGNVIFTPSNSRADYFGLTAPVDPGMLFGAITDGSNNTINGIPDFRIRFILDSKMNLVYARGGYRIAAGSAGAGSFDGSEDDGSFVTFSIKDVALPEPASWAMMVGGLGVVGALMRRRQKVAISFA